MPRLIAIVLLTVVAPAFAQGDARFNYLIKRLEKSADARGRAQAALILGASDESAALAPLCRALVADAEAVVRSAAAQALGELGDVEALSCLKKRATSETDAAAKAAVVKATRALEAQKNRRPTVYVLLDDVRDGRERPDTTTAKLANERLRKQLMKMGAVLAPPGEPAKAAQAAMKKRKLKGYYLMPKLESAGAGVKLTIVGATYPARALLGQVSTKASGADPSTLIRALVPSVLKEASSTFDWEVSP